MTTKKVQKRGASRKSRPSVKTRARAIVADAKGYDEETRHAIQNSLDGDGSDLAELVRRAESGETILDVSAEAEAFKQAAQEYAGNAYAAALAHYEANHNRPFALSRLAVVYEETEPGDFHTVVTLPGRMRDRTISDGALHKWLATVEMLCRTLEHPNCSDAFQQAFGATFTDNILDGSAVSWTTPTVVRVMLPLTLLEMVKNCDGVPEQFLAIFETLREALNDTATAEEVRASVVGT